MEIKVLTIDLILRKYSEVVNEPLTRDLSSDLSCVDCACI